MIVIHTERADAQEHGGQGRRSFYQHMCAVFSYSKSMASGVNVSFLAGKKAASNLLALLLFAYVRLAKASCVIVLVYQVMQL